ncbi:hypothetical protein EVAR_66319_1 [Eumeta japonica]|uniref:Uncharacterized protein n=1 Tax=Eumeta variegata TaxID=151549 RepID=A0A4C1ZVM3_EUMVA|nr:hypothetical protein EVAR_66319_1 [Eumeta japonica]
MRQRSRDARRAQAAHGTFPERGPGTNSLPYMMRCQCVACLLEGNRVSNERKSRWWRRRKGNGPPEELKETSA